MKVAITGASGFIGSAVVRLLEGEGHEIVRFVRRPAERRDEIAWHPSSGEVEQWERLDGVEGFVNLAGESLAAGRWTPERKDEILRSRVEGTRNLVAVMAHMNHLPRVLVSASGINYYGDRGEKELDESSGRGEGFLADVCRAWEEEARIAESVGIHTVVLRTGLVLGPGGGALAKMLPAFRAGFGGRLGDGAQWLSWISLDDLVAIIRAALQDRRLGGPVNAVAPTAVRNADFAAGLGRALHRPAVVPVPAILLRTLYGQMADETLLASMRVRPRRLVDAGFNYSLPDLESALRTAVSGAADRR